MDECEAQRGYGDIGNGTVMGITEISVRKPAFPVVASLVFKGMKVKGVPCIGLFLSYDEETESFVLPSSATNTKSVSLGFIDAQGLSMEIVMDEEGWEEDARRSFALGGPVWSPISEILNNRHIYGIPIESEVSRIFEQNPIASFLFDDEGTVIPSPTVVYNGAYSAEIAAAVGIGKSRASPYASLGPNYYFGTFEYARRFAVATLDGKKRVVNGNTITRNNSGVYEEGSIARYVLMEGRIRLKTDASCIDTVIVPKEKYGGAAYVTKDYDNFELVDFAKIDTKKVSSANDAEKATLV